MANSKRTGRRPGLRSPTEVDKRVGRRIRALRNERRMTMAELADQLGISHQQLQKYETGANRVSASMVFEVAQAFGVGVEVIFEEEPGKRTSKRDAAERFRRECLVWIDRAQSVETLKTIDRVLRALSDD